MSKTINIEHCFDDHVLLRCPNCGCGNLHQTGVEVCVREREDGSGRRFVMKGGHIVAGSPEGTTEEMEARDPDFVGRRDDLKISFFCEGCGELKDRLVIHQHKGETLIAWEE